MDILGEVSDGVVVLKDPKALPDGTVVRVEAVGSVGSSEAAVQDASSDRPVRRGTPLREAGAACLQTEARQQPSEAEEERKEGPTIWDKLRDLAGTAKGLPSDLARNHDHYLHGLPKK